jgi:solute:Na+ symporter, SSS family
MKVVLGWDIYFSIWVSSLTVALYVALGGLLSAIFNEVLQFVLIWLGALLIPIIGLIEAGGWNGMVARIHQNFPTRITPTCGAPGLVPGQPHGHHWTGIVFGLGAVISWATGPPISWWCSACSAKDLRARQDGAAHRRGFKMCVPFIVILPGLLGWPCCRHHFLVPESHRALAGQVHSYNEVLPLMLARYCGPGCWAWDHRADRRLHVGHGGQRQRLRHGVDLRHLPRHDPQEAPPTQHYVSMGRWCTIGGACWSASARRTW